MMEMPVSQNLYELSKAANAHLYLVGGSVRNYLLFGKEEQTDKDICGILPAQEMFSKEIPITCINRRLGTYKVIFHGEEYEYTPFRQETYTKGHSPDSVTFGCGLEEDALRRDFTVNAIYFDITQRKTVDPLNGYDDIKNKKIRKISDSTLRADGLRLMRAVRFAAQLDFEIEDTTKKAICDNAALIKDISSERIRDELQKILRADIAYGVKYAHYRGMKLLKETGLLAIILPELNLCNGVRQNPKYHKYDVLEHIFQVVKYSAPDIREAALFHDVGKPLCIDSLGHMKGHDVIGAEITRTIMKRLRYSNFEIDETVALVKAHMFDLKGEASESKVKLFVVNNFNRIDKITKLKEADIRGCGFDTQFVFNSADKLQAMKEKILIDGTPLSIQELCIDGDDLIELGAHGAVIGNILADLYRDCVLNPKLNNREWLLARAAKMVKIYRNASNKT